MADELKWSRSEKKKQIERAVHFLGTMGLAPDAVLPEPVPRGLLERLENVVWKAVAGIVEAGYGGSVKRGAAYGRAQFEAGEVAALKDAFAARARKVVDVVGDVGVEERRVRKGELVEILKGVPGYERVRAQDYEYVLEEAGFKNLEDVGFDEFVEVGFDFEEVVLSC